MFRAIISLYRKLRSRLGFQPSVEPLPVRSVSAAEEAERILDLVDREGRITYLPSFYWILVQAPDEYRVKIGAAVERVLRSIKPDRLPWIGDLCRARGYSLAPIDWSRKRPEELIPAGVEADVRLALYGFSSFHPVGYFREKAVRLLAEERSGGELSYLLIRMNDWVEPVRKIARDAVAERLVPGYAVHFRGLLPLVQKIKRWAREDHSSIVSAIERLISSDKEILLGGLAAPDGETRRVCYRLAAQSSVISGRELLTALLRERESAVRSLALKLIADKLSRDEVEACIEPLLRDPFAPVRTQALALYCTFFLSSAENLLKKCACDKALSVREISRFYLKQLGVTDIIGLYCERLATTTAPDPGLLLGIGEAGSVENVPLLTGFLSHHASRVVKAAIRSIMSLAPDKATNLLQPFIADERPGVSKLAMICLSLRSFEVDEEKMAAIFRSSKVHHVRRNSLRLLCLISHWASIFYIIEACAQEDAALRQIGFNALEKWLKTGVHISTDPSPEQAFRAQQALERHGEAFDGFTRRQLAFFLKGTIERQA